MSIPTFEDVTAARERIRPYVHRTPVLTSSYLNGLTGANLLFKCENFQKAGAFKVRGASNAVFQLPAEGQNIAHHHPGSDFGFGDLLVFQGQYAGRQATFGQVRYRIGDQFFGRRLGFVCGILFRMA